MAYYSYAFANEEEVRAFVLTCEARFCAQVERASAIAHAMPQLKYVALSGPSCAGKTTTAGLMIKELQEKGYSVEVISIDDFFHDRKTLDDMAKKSGKLDLDSVKAIDLDELSRFVTCIEEGRVARRPHFDFTKGACVGYTEILPKKEHVFLFEGIQAFYPEVAALFPKEETLRVFISVHETLKTPYGTFLPRERRLLRRLLRDYHRRSTPISRTLLHWEGVTANELHNIEPYQEDCDVMIDSSMPYELGVLRAPLLALLDGVSADEPRADEAKRIAEKIRPFPDISPSMVPKHSVMREFIGYEDQ